MVVAIREDGSEGGLPLLRVRPHPSTVERTRGRDARERIMAAALRHFTTRGYRATRLEDIAADAGLTRPGLFRYFASKDDLLFEVHTEAALRLGSYLDAPEQVIDSGFFATLRYWLERWRGSENGPDRDYLMVLVGKYCTDFDLQERISRFWLSEDPEGTVEFVEFGQRRGDIASHLDPLIVAALVDWVIEGFHRSVAARELDRARLFHTRRTGAERFDATVETVLATLRLGLT